jgi:hypothetical protein
MAPLVTPASSATAFLDQRLDGVRRMVVRVVAFG